MRSYYSAIKAILRSDDYIVDDNKVLLNSLAKACKIVNDRVHTRLPIQYKLLELLLFEIQRLFSEQYYLEVLYRTIFLLAYYGLWTTGQHPIKASNVHIGQNKDKLLFVLYSSKTHGRESHPQKVKIVANANSTKKVNSSACKRFFCPFSSLREYLELRGDYESENDPFFIFHDNNPVKPTHVRKVLSKLLKAINLDPSLYGSHSFRIGRATDMVVVFGYSISQAKIAGRWRSNTVYKYIRQTQF